MSFIGKIFGRFNEPATAPEESDLELSSPVEGTIVPLEDVPDPVICEKIAGDGCAFIPEGSTIVSPCDGMICRLMASNTAFAVRTDSGIEVYVRFGVGTDDFAAGGFTARKKVGDRVQRGEEIISMDLTSAAPELKSTVISMIVMNSSASIERITSAVGQVKGADTPCVWVYLKKS